MSALFGKKPKAPEVARMPVDDDVAVQAAQDRQRKAIASRGGRSSTVLSRSNGEGGTSAYRASLLGNAG